MRRLGRFLSLLAVPLTVAAALGLASCKEQLPPCPIVKVRQPLNQITKFVPGAPVAEQNVVYASRIRAVGIKCEYAEIKARQNAKGQGGADTMDVNLKLSFETLRGAAATGDAVKAEYFVVVTDRRQTVLNRQVFPVTLSVPNGPGTASTEDESWMKFDLEGRNGLAFEIYVGFQLTDEEKEYNERLLSGS